MAQEVDFSSIFFAPSEERNLCLLFDNPNQIPNQQISDDSANEKLKIWVAKDLLAVAGPVFKKMFYVGGFCESLGLSDNEPIYLPGKNVSDFLEFLKCLFPLPDRKKINLSNVYLVLPLADEYHVEMLMKKCIKRLKQKILRHEIGDKEILNDVPFFVKYRLTEVIRMVVPKAAALNADDLMLFRRANRDQLPTDHGFYFAIYEAIANRLRCETHEKGENVSVKCKTCSQSENMFKCVKCEINFCAECSRRQCATFHTCYRFPDSPCVCGYQYTEELIKLI